MKNFAVLTALVLITGSSLAWVLPAARQDRNRRAALPPAPEAREADAWPSALSWVDVDRDGRLETLVIHPDGRAALIREAPGGGLEDCTEELGLARVPAAHRVRWQDVNGDAAPDLLIVARDGSVQLLRNELESGFSDVTPGSGLDHSGGVVEAAWRARSASCGCDPSAP